MCSCGLGKAGMGRTHHGCPRTQLEEARPISRRLRSCPISEPEVVESASAAKQSTLGFAHIMIQVLF